MDEDKTMLADKGEMLHQKFFRLIHRARSKSQKRRVYSWAAVFFIFVFMLIYSYQEFFTSLADNIHTEPLPIEVVTKRIQQPSIQNEENNPQQNKNAQNDIRAGVGMKILETKDSENVKHINHDHNHKVGRLSNIDPNDPNYMYGYDNIEEESHSDLLPDLAPSIIHFVWCGKIRYFEFRHYLVVKRANHLIKPDKIIFHYVNLPQIDEARYYDWFNKTLSEIDHIVLKPLQNVTSCDISGANKYLLVLSLLEASGGVFIPEDALLIDFPVHLRASPFISGVIAKTMSEYMDGIIVAKKNGFVSPSSQNGLNVVLASGRSEIQGMIPPCGDRTHFNYHEQGECICVKIDSEIYPSTLWSERSNFSALARVASYGTSAVGPARNTKTLIPKIGHYICWNCELKFQIYLSVMSSLHVAGLNKVYIHGLKEPSGSWWKLLQATDRVVYVNREYPVHSRDTATMTQELAQGIMRVNILLKYGGVYCNNKVIWTNPIPQHYFEYEAVASPDWHQFGIWPDSISHTTIMARKNAEYLSRLRNLHHQYARLKFWFVDQFMSYKILEHNPTFLFLDRHFQVKCQNHNCHPTWVEGYKAPMDENPQGGKFNWQNESLSVYWDVFPPLELDTVKYTSGLVVDVARHALKAAGINIQQLAKH